MYDTHYNSLEAQEIKDIDATGEGAPFTKFVNLFKLING